MGSALLPQETHNKDTGCLSPDDFGDGGCSRFLHFAQRVLQETLPSPHPGQRPASYRGTTHFHTLPSPPRPTALQTFRHARVPPSCTWLRSLPSLAREPRHHLPELPFALLRPRTNTHQHATWRGHGRLTGMRKSYQSLSRYHGHWPDLVQRMKGRMSTTMEENRLAIFWANLGTQNNL